MNTITTKNTRIAALKGSITESLIGAIPNSGKPLDDYRAESLSKYEGHPAPDGASPTQPYKCGQYVKVKVKTALSLTLTLI